MKDPAEKVDTCPSRHLWWLLEETMCCNCEGLKGSWTGHRPQFLERPARHSEGMGIFQQWLCYGLCVIFLHQQSFLHQQYPMDNAQVGMIMLSLARIERYSWRQQNVLYGREPFRVLKRMYYKYFWRAQTPAPLPKTTTWNLMRSCRRWD